MERVTSNGRLGMLARLKAGLARCVDQAGWEARRGARRFTRRYGWLGWGLLVCVIVAVLALLVGHQQMAAVRSLQARLTEQIAEHKRLSIEVVEPHRVEGSDGRVRLKAFEAYLLPHEDIPAVVQGLLRLAEDEKLSIQRGEYRAQIDTVGGFMRYRMILPVKGPAPAIHHFMQAAMRTQKTLALDSVQFKRERIELSEIEARIQWVVLTRLPLNEAGTTAAVSAGSKGFQ